MNRMMIQLMNRMMIRGSLLATVATVALLACVMGPEAKGGTAKPPSGSQDMGTLSAANDYNVLLNLTLKNGSPVVHTVDVGDIPDNRSWLLLAVKTYWNKYPSFTVVDPSGNRHEIGGIIKDPNQSNTFWISVPAEQGQYEIELASNGGTYTYFVEAILVSEEGWPW
jgi:hypothetical protein